MALTDVQAILVKASFTTETVEARIGQVSLDVANEGASLGNPIAYEVEQVGMQLSVYNMHPSNFNSLIVTSDFYRKCLYLLHMQIICSCLYL